MRILERTDEKLVFIYELPEDYKVLAALLLGFIDLVFLSLSFISIRSIQGASGAIIATVLFILSLIFLLFIITINDTILYEFNKAENIFSITRKSTFFLTRSHQIFQISTIFSADIETYGHKINLNIENRSVYIETPSIRASKEILREIHQFLPNLILDDEPRRHASEYSSRECEQFRESFKVLYHSQKRFSGILLTCPACHHSVYGLGSYCPECGSYKTVQSIDTSRIGGLIKSSISRCTACNKRIEVDNQGDRSYKIRACSFCGLMLDEKGL